jgi:hypothetical protein
MNEFVNRKVLNQLRSLGDSLTSLHLNNPDFLEGERKKAIACLSSEVAADPHTRDVLQISHNEFLYRTKSKMRIRAKFTRLNSDEVKILCAAVLEYGKELDLYYNILNMSVSFENLKKFEGDMSLLDGFTDRELEILLELISDL